jgi:tol-pal system protein YbgF
LLRASRIHVGGTNDMRLLLCSFGFLLIPSFVFGANKDIVELSRDVATLQDQVRTLQSSNDQKLAALTVLLQQTLDAANGANRAVAVLDARINDKLEKQGVSVGQPIAVVAAKVDQMSNDFGGMKDALNDLVSRIGKLDQRLVELNNTVRTIQAPPPPPAATDPTAAGAVPAVPPDTLYEMAFRDRSGGKPDMALSEFRNYVQLYPDTDKAPSAQFWIGQIFFERRDFPNAIKAFDQVLEQWQSNNKTPEAMLKKGQALVLMDKRTDGAAEFRQVLTKYPHSDMAPKACSELKALGYNCSPPAPLRGKKRG